MSLLATILFAEGEGGSLFPFVLLIIFALFWLVVLRPMKRQEAEKQAKLLNSMKKNDKVLTTSGIYGTVISIDENQDRVLLRIDDDKGGKVAFTKGSIARVLDGGTDKDKPTEAA